MSRVIDFLRNLREDVRKHNIARLEDEFSDGFNEAADICPSVLSANIGDLSNQIKSGGQPSDQEQLLLSRLYEIKSETETRLQGFRRNVNNR